MASVWSLHAYVHACQRYWINFATTGGFDSNCIAFIRCMYMAVLSVVACISIVHCMYQQLSKFSIQFNFRYYCNSTLIYILGRMLHLIVNVCLLLIVCVYKFAMMLSQDPLEDQPWGWRGILSN